LSEGLRTAPPEVRHQVFEAPSLKIVLDQHEESIEISTAVTDEVAKGLGGSQHDLFLTWSPD
jgi:hypothetical protein